MQLFNATLKTPLREWRTDMVINTGLQTEARQSLLQWAHSSPEIHDAIITDIVLYDFAVERFKEQTRTVLGTVWDA